MPKKVLDAFFNALVRDIKNHYQPGDKYPSIRAIAEQHRISIQTAQRGVKKLEEFGGLNYERLTGNFPNYLLHKNDGLDSILTMQIQITDESGQVLLNKKLTGLPLKESAIIDATKEYHNDPYPCIIRRSAVMKVMFSQIEDMLKGRGSSLPLVICDLPERFSCLVDLPENARHVIFQD